MTKSFVVKEVNFGVHLLIELDGKIPQIYRSISDTSSPSLSSIGAAFVDPRNHADAENLARGSLF